MARLETCGECEHKQFVQVGPRGFMPGIWVCPLASDDPDNPRIVPQGTDHERSEFRRVPPWCPRPDDEVIKRGDNDFARPLNRTVIPVAQLNASKGEG